MVHYRGLSKLETFDFECRMSITFFAQTKLGPTLKLTELHNCKQCNGATVKVQFSAVFNSQRDGMCLFADSTR